jgi:hypothetical protein
VVIEAKVAGATIRAVHGARGLRQAAFDASVQVGNALRNLTAENLRQQTTPAEIIGDAPWIAERDLEPADKPDGPNTENNESPKEPKESMMLGREKPRNDNEFSATKKKPSNTNDKQIWEDSNEEANTGVHRCLMILCGLYWHRSLSLQFG